MARDREKYGKTIRISNENYSKLAEMGNLIDSFDSVISKLLDRAAQKK